MILNEGNYKRLVMQHARSHRIIRSATIELLDACNFRCKHCYVRDTYNRYIDTTTVKKFLFELKEGGCIWLLLTGGEPLLHPNFLKVYLYAYSLGFKITLFTNGYLLDDSVIDVLTKYPPELIEITLYGYDDTSFDSYVGVKGAFKKIDNNINILKERKISLKLKSVVTKDNMNSIDLIKKYATNKGIEYRCDAFIVPTVLGDKYPLYVRVDENDAVKYDLNDQEYVNTLSSVKLNPPSDELYTCDAGYNSLFIDANMRISMCLMARHIGVSLNDLDKKSIKEAQTHIIALREKKRKLEETDACFRCDKRAICRYCPGQFLSATGDEYVPIKWNCNYADILLSKIRSK